MKADQERRGSNPAIARRPDAGTCCYLADRPAGQPVWSGTRAEDAAEMLRIDLQAAGIPYRDADDLVADFHALRHSYISLMASSGIHPKTAQSLARHSTITLTMDRYAHVTLLEQGQAVQALPPLLPSTVSTTPAPQVPRATGADGGAPGPRLDQTFARTCANLQRLRNSPRRRHHLLQNVTL